MPHWPPSARRKPPLRSAALSVVLHVAAICIVMWALQLDARRAVVQRVERAKAPVEQRLTYIAATRATPTRSTKPTGAPPKARRAIGSDSAPPVADTTALPKPATTAPDRAGDDSTRVSSPPAATPPARDSVAATKGAPYERPIHPEVRGLVPRYAYPALWARPSAGGAYRALPERPPACFEGESGYFACVRNLREWTKDSIFHVTMRCGKRAMPLMRPPDCDRFRTDTL